MSYQYNHFLLPLERKVRPSHSQIACLVAELRESGYLPADLSDYENVECFYKNQPDSENLTRAFGKRPFNLNGIERSPKSRDLAQWPETHWFDQFEGHDLILTWRINDREALKLKHPLTEPHPNIHDWPECNYLVSICSTHDYQDIARDMLTGIIKPECQCGRPLKYTVNGDFTVDSMQKVMYCCLDCGQVFDPTAIESWTRTWRPNEFRIPFRGGGINRFYVLVDVGKALPSNTPQFTAEFISICATIIDATTIQVGEVA